MIRKAVLMLSMISCTAGDAWKGEAMAAVRSPSAVAARKRRDSSTNDWSHSDASEDEALLNIFMVKTL